MVTKTQIKICGLSRLEDIKKINNFNIDYVGFVFAPSKRMIDPEQARILIKNLSPRIKSVGVFVDENLDNVNDIIDYCQLDIAQLHGSENPDYCLKINRPVWKSISISSREDIVKHEMYKKVDGILLDTFTPGLVGGSGRSFAWELAQGLKRDKVILAGGLSPSNVALAIDTLRPKVVDVSSGVESGGIKDFDKIKNFIRSVESYG